MGTAAAVVTLILNKTDGTTVNLGTAVETGSAHLWTKAMDFGQDEFAKYLEHIIANIEDRQQNERARLEIWGADDEEGPYEQLDTIWLAEEDPGWTDPPGQRFYKFRFYDDRIATRWAIHGLTIFGEIGGEEW